ncbi:MULTISPECIES: flavodoxin domain-containing protein [Bacillaceae]|uniref:Flavodoxin n=1 Tax=Alkalicoccobacillus plakortidis TaxID=444060 RepID=A0A9D5DPJ9_9BACI|nr:MULTISPECIES: flavodoxin domain-containing protein [Bacillaceae]KQL56715.1 flavodoxin [Alkalicoccobacillus plakortidis]
MMRICLLYASMSGNTEDMAIIIKKELEKEEIEVVMEEMDGYEVEKLTDFTGIILGSYTWGDGDLPYEVEEFEEELVHVDLSRIPAAVFGSGDRNYPSYCEAVHIFEKTLKKAGAVLVCSGFKNEFEPKNEEEIEACRHFAQQFSVALKERV